MVQMKKSDNVSVVISQILLLFLIVIVFLPGKKQTDNPVYFLWGIAVIEGIYLFHMNRQKGKRFAFSAILSILWSVLLLWEILVTKLDLLHPVLVPALENVFADRKSVV